MTASNIQTEALPRSDRIVTHLQKNQASEQKNQRVAQLEQSAAQTINASNNLCSAPHNPSRALHNPVNAMIDEIMRIVAGTAPLDAYRDSLNFKSGFSKLAVSVGNKGANLF